MAIDGLKARGLHITMVSGRIVSCREGQMLTMHTVVDGGQWSRSTAYCVTARCTSDGIKCKSLKEVGTYQSFAERRSQGCYGTLCGNVV